MAKIKTTLRPMTQEPDISFQQKTIKFFKDLGIVGEILARFAVSLTLTILAVKLCVHLAARCTGVPEIRIFLTDGFFANFLAVILPLFAFLFTTFVLLPMPLGKAKPVKTKRRRRKISPEALLLLVSYSLALISLWYAGKSYVAITDDKIYISTIDNFFDRKVYPFEAVEGVKVRGKQGKGGASIKFFIRLDGRDIDIWPGGWYDRANIASNVRRVYQKLKTRKIALDLDLSYLNEKQVQQIRQILE